MENRGESLLDYGSFSEELVFFRLKVGPFSNPVLAGVLASAFQVGGSLTMHVFRGYGIHTAHSIFLQHRSAARH